MTEPASMTLWIQESTSRRSGVGCELGRGEVSEYMTIVGMPYKARHCRNEANSLLKIVSRCHLARFIYPMRVNFWYPFCSKPLARDTPRDCSRQEMKNARIFLCGRSPENPRGCDPLTAIHSVQTQRAFTTLRRGWPAFILQRAEPRREFSVIVNGNLDIPPIWFRLKGRNVSAPALLR